MKRTRTVAIRLAVLSVAGLLPLAAAVAAETRGVEVEGLAFNVPQSWKDSKATSSMRKLQVSVPPAEGDKEAGELAVFVFPGGAGTVDANIERWQRQFRGADGAAVKPETSKVKGQNVQVTRVELGGTYTDPFAGKGAQAGYRLLGAIVEGQGSSYFIKLIGPEKTLQAAEKDFDAMIASMKLAGR